MTTQEILASMTLDESIDAFTDTPNFDTAKALILVSAQYAADEMISQEEADAWFVKALECTSRGNTDKRSNEMNMKNRGPVEEGPNLDVLASDISNELSANLVAHEELRNAGRVAFASGLPRIPPSNITDAFTAYWLEGFDDGSKVYGSKRKRPAARVRRAERITNSMEAEHTGGSVDYYKLRIEHPTHIGTPYDVECNDIIEALQMDYAEGNVFKAIWRTAASRQGKMKKGHDAKYDAEKIVFFGQRLLERAKRYLGG